MTIVMQQKIAAGAFKAQCLGLLDEVEQQRIEIVITKRGKPVARLVPVSDAAPATPGLSLYPLTPEIAIESSRLPGQFHGDPADRILLATARMTGARLLTKDERLLAYGRQRHAPVLAA